MSPRIPSFYRNNLAVFPCIYFYHTPHACSIAIFFYVLVASRHAEIANCVKHIALNFTPQTAWIVVAAVLGQSQVALKSKNTCSDWLHNNKSFFSDLVTKKKEKKDSGCRTFPIKLGKFWYYLIVSVNTLKRYRVPIPSLRGQPYIKWKWARR